MTGDEQEITNHDPESRLESGFQKKKKKEKKAAKSSLPYLGNFEYG